MPPVVKQYGPFDRPFRKTGKRIFFFPLCGFFFGFVVCFFFLEHNDLNS